MILHPDHGCRFTSGDYRRFLKGHNLLSSMRGVGRCADNAAMEGFFGLLKRERDNRRKYRTRSEAGADVFDCIERFHNPGRRRQLEAAKQNDLPLTHRPLKRGKTRRMSPVEQMDMHNRAIFFS